MQTNELVPEWIVERLGRPAIRQWIGIGVAAAAYLFAVIGDSGRTPSSLLTAILPSLALLMWRRWPAVALALVFAGAGVMIVVAWLSFSFGPGAVVVLVLAAMVTEFGLVIRDLPGLRWAAAADAALIVVTVLVSGGGGFVSAVFVGMVLAALPLVAGWGWRQARGRWSATSALAESETRQHDIEREVTIEQERNRVAREVHDVVAHSLAVVIAQADGARYQARTSPESVAPALDAIADTARGALIEVRTLLESLRHRQGAAPAPLMPDLDTLYAQMRELGLLLDVQAFGPQRTLGDATQLGAYRIVQEALTNALRHGDTSAPVCVDFDWGERTLAITVTNTLVVDGVPQLDGPGHGIPGMRERAALAGGDLTVGVGTRGTFRVRAGLPVPAVRPVAQAPRDVVDEILSAGPSPAADSTLTRPVDTRPYLLRDEERTDTPPAGVRLDA